MEPKPLSKAVLRYVPRKWRDLPPDQQPTVVWEPMSGKARGLALAESIATGFSTNNDIPLWIAVADRAIVALERWRDVDGKPVEPVVVRGKASEAIDDEALIFEIVGHVWARGRVTPVEEGKSPSPSASPSGGTDGAAPPAAPSVMA